MVARPHAKNVKTSTPVWEAGLCARWRPLTTHAPRLTLIGESTHDSSALTRARSTETCDLRLLLLHHHVAIPDSRKYSRWTRLKNMTEAIESMLRADIDLVMFGHEHYHYLGERTYSDHIGDRRVRRRLLKDGYEVEKRLITCMCGTTTCHDGGANLAWRVVIDKPGDRYRLRFTLLEANTRAGTLKPVAGAGKDILLYRRAAR